jgi:hypothetical protein
MIAEVRVANARDRSRVHDRRAVRDRSGVHDRSSVHDRRRNDEAGQSPGPARMTP